MTHPPRADIEPSVPRPVVWADTMPTALDAPALDVDLSAWEADAVAGVASAHSTAGAGAQAQRHALLVSADSEERMYWRARLALAHLVWVDEASTTVQAEAAMDARRYRLAVFNLDGAEVAGAVLARRLRLTQPQTFCVVTHAAAVSGAVLNWEQGRELAALTRCGVHCLPKPFSPRAVADLLAHVTARQ